VTAGHVHRVHGSWDKETSVQLTPMRDVKLEGARRKQPQTIALTPSGDNPLPELLLDARPVSIRAERRAEMAARALVSSGAYTATELQDL
ncbi:MAG: hypothetical protein M3506_09290, partial [Chloroflexota bacterium]|nr:hypothetical protein [Chloroflexota bacterium]